jgi:hypothetical protein
LRSPEALIKVVLVSGDESHIAVLEKAEGPESIPLGFENPLRIKRREFLSLRSARITVTASYFFMIPVKTSQNFWALDSA